MKVLLINGSPHKEGCTYTALREVADTLEKCEVETEIFWLGTKAVQDCTACNSCIQTGKCVFDDDVNKIAGRLEEFDGMVLGSPVYYAAPSGRLCSFLDRLFYFNGAAMAGKVGAAVVSCRRGGNTAAWDRLNKYFGMNNMFIVGSQYWNQVHGSTPEDVKKDLEGLQTMRTLAQNTAFLLKSIEAGREIGVAFPQYEKPIYTNFIRK